MIKAGFILLTVIMALLVFAALAHAAHQTITNHERQSKFKIRAAAIITGWLVYISILSLNGVFTSLALPPRIPLLLVLPAFTFMFFFFRSGRFTWLISATPAAWVIYAQSFRIVVELLLAGLMLEGSLPKAATFEGYNFEIAIGITSLLVGYLGGTKKRLSPAAIIAWNIAGLCTLSIVVFIVIGHAYAPQMWADGDPHFIARFGIFPYTLLAGFLMPLAVFMHIFSITKTVATRRTGPAGTFGNKNQLGKAIE